MISSRTAILLRNLSTSRVNHRPSISDHYKSLSLWNERFSCKLLRSDADTIRAIDNKVLVGSSLTNLEIDIFINSALPRVDETIHLEESTKLISQIRKSIWANNVLPSTNHALCRLYLYSDRIKSLATILSNRITFGVFADNFVMNLILDETLRKEDYCLASKFASQVMLQEEFGTNKITDTLCLFSFAKYLESGDDFKSWISDDLKIDEIACASLGLEYRKPTQDDPEQESPDEASNEDKDEDDAEYIRVPFLRNPYNDDHFDLVDPKQILGKSLACLGQTILSQGDRELGYRAKILGNIMRGRWSDVQNDLKLSSNSDIHIGDIKEIALRLSSYSCETDADDHNKRTVIDELSKLISKGKLFTELIESRSPISTELENLDVRNLRESYQDCSRQRHMIIERARNREICKKLEQEIADKKMELERRERYLYFYDNLRKSKLLRIEYD